MSIDSLGPRKSREPSIKEVNSTPSGGDFDELWLLALFDKVFFPSTRSCCFGAGLRYARFQYFPDAMIAAKAETEDLKAAGVGHERISPLHKFMQAASVCHVVFTGLQVEVIGVRNEKFTARCFHFFAG